MGTCRGVASDRGDGEGWVIMGGLSRDAEMLRDAPRAGLPFRPGTGLAQDNGALHTADMSGINAYIYTFV